MLNEPLGDVAQFREVKHWNMFASGRFSLLQGSLCFLAAMRQSALIYNHLFSLMTFSPNSGQGLENETLENIHQNKCFLLEVFGLFFNNDEKLTNTHTYATPQTKEH